MRKLIVLAAAALTTLAFTGSAFAQGAPPAGPPPGGPAPAGDEGGDYKKMGIGGDLLFLVPLGDLSDATGPQIGPLFRFGYRVIPALEITGRVGYLLGIKKEIGNVLGTSISEGVNVIPLWAGARYFFMDPAAGFYGAAELGINLISASVSGGGSSSSGDTKARIGANLGAGYVISKELPIDIRAQLTMYNLLLKDSATATAGGTTVSIDEPTYLGIGISAGYTFQF